MKRLFFLAALLSLPVVAATAQETAPPVQAAPQHVHHASPHKAAVRMAHELNLSADQQARLEPILAERQQKTAAIRGNTQLTEADRRQQLKTVHHESRTEMSSVLTPDQMRQLKAMHHSHHAPSAPPAGV